MPNLQHLFLSALLCSACVAEVDDSTDIVEANLLSAPCDELDLETMSVDPLALEFESPGPEPCSDPWTSPVPGGGTDPAGGEAGACWFPTTFTGSGTGLDPLRNTALAAARREARDEADRACRATSFYFPFASKECTARPTLLQFSDGGCLENEVGYFECASSVEVRCQYEVR